jgi:hypothetical protein
MAHFLSIHAASAVRWMPLGLILLAMSCLAIAPTVASADLHLSRTVIEADTIILSPAESTALLAFGAVDLRAIVSGGVIETAQIVFGYETGADPVATIRASLTASRGGGSGGSVSSGLFHWDVGQFQSSTAWNLGMTLGYFDNTSDVAVKGHAPHTVTVMPTYPGDFNLDGSVDGEDLGVYIANKFDTGMDWFAGDANYDDEGGVTSQDFIIEIANRTRTLVVPAGSLPDAVGATKLGGRTVPEPGTFALLAAGLIVTVVPIRRLRHRMAS